MSDQLSLALIKRAYHQAAKIMARYGCSATKNKGDSICGNRRTIKQKRLRAMFWMVRKAISCVKSWSRCSVKSTSSILHTQAKAQHKSLESRRESLLKEREA